MKKLFIITLTFLIFIFFSCADRNKTLIEFSEKLAESTRSKKIYIGEDVSYSTQLSFGVNYIINNECIRTGNRMTDGKIESESILILINYQDNRHDVFYFNFGGKHNAIHSSINRENNLAVLFKGRGRDYFTPTPWRFYLPPQKSRLHFLLPEEKKYRYTYDQFKMVNKMGYDWFVFLGKVQARGGAILLAHPGNIILFEIWIREDQQAWLEFYKNISGELKVAKEGAFQFTVNESKIRNPKCTNEIKENFDSAFKDSFMYNMEMVKDSRLANGLYDSD